MTEWDMKRKLPKIAGIFAPPQLKGTDGHKKQFGFIWLEDNSVGFMFTPLSADLPERLRKMNPSKIVGQNPLQLIKDLGNKDELQQLLAFGALNAVSQHVFSVSQFKFDFTSDPFGLLDISSSDLVGMVGFFPPLVNYCNQHGIPLIVIEKKAELVQHDSNFEVTLESSRLNECNKILITGTTVLNNTINDILKECKKAKKIAMVGPSASILPDPLFERGITALGGSRVFDFNRFHYLCERNDSWDPAVQKYCIIRNQYPGWKFLLERALNH